MTLPHYPDPQQSTWCHRLKTESRKLSLSERCESSDLVDKNSTLEQTALPRCEDYNRINCAHQLLSIQSFWLNRVWKKPPKLAPIRALPEPRSS